MRRVVLALAGTTAFIFAPLCFSNQSTFASPVNYNWTGFYFGGSGGYAWQKNRVDLVPVDPGAGVILGPPIAVFGSTTPGRPSFDNNRGIWGIQVGYNWQTSRDKLVGFEADFNWMNRSGTGTSNFLFPGAGVGIPSNIQATQDVKWLATLRARAGWLPTNNWLLYGTAGVAFARVDESAVLNSGAGANLNTTSGGTTWGVVCVTGPNCFLGSTSRTAIGWTAGAGTEFALWRNVSIKMEYIYVSLDKGNGVISVAQNAGAAGNIPMSFRASFDPEIHIVRAGLNFRFGGP